MSRLTITRTFALFPTEHSHHPYREITNLLVKERALKNKYVALMAEDIWENSYDAYRSTSLSKFRQAVYDRLSLSQVNSPQFQKIILKERAKQCAFYDAYFSVREWIKRIENLKQIITIIGNTREIILLLLKGKRLSSGVLKDMRDALCYDCFGEKQNLSNDFLNNIIFQIRNLFLLENDYTITELLSTHVSLNPLQADIKENFKTMDLTDTFADSIASSFTRKRKGKEAVVPLLELPEYMINCLFRKYQWITTRKAQQICSLRKKIQVEQARKKRNIRKLEGLVTRVNNIRCSLSLLMGDIEFSSIREFKKKRKVLLDPLKDDFLKKSSSLDLQNLIRVSFEKELMDITQNGNSYVLKRIFKPHYPTIPLVKLDYNAFIRYFTLRLQYKVREFLKESFISESFLSLVYSQLEKLKKNLSTIVPLPHHKQLSLSIINRDVYKEDFKKHQERTQYKIKLGFISRQFKTLYVKDDKLRIKALLEAQFIPALPKISLKQRKLLLHLPFYKSKKDISKPPSNGVSSPFKMGIDLGVKHFAVISIRNNEIHKEVARYFLGPKQLFGMKLNPNDGKLYPLLIDGAQKRSFNIKMKVIRLREHIRSLQKKKNKYEQRLLSQHITNFRKKFKWNHIRKHLSLCWERLQRLHLQIVHYLNHIIISIAKFYNVSTIKVEDLRWACHLKKRDVGKFLCFWQTHWFYSQIQSAIKLQCRFSSIRFHRVPARNTSKRCSRCGNMGIRDAKTFTCPHCNMILDSDLNAARNIAQYKKDTNKITYHIDAPYMGAQDLQLQVTKEDVE